ncbi:uncharacterized protein CDAR_257431 [Caerostris darwini]|uniref:Uncharacterized protein n=1 Tax=Caerostris darwini TaxID=1538125 RepID=A0AAV4TCN5_9ARAC|nr:uncharacterized protein CDAR_257431 [Caerostris darwini]
MGHHQECFFLSSHPHLCYLLRFTKQTTLFRRGPLESILSMKKIGRDAVEKAGRASTKDVIEARFTAGYPPDGLFNFTPQCHLRGAHRASLGTVLPAADPHSNRTLDGHTLQTELV